VVDDEVHEGVPDDSAAGPVASAMPDLGFTVPNTEAGV
jgi:hypothetical protein